MAYYVLQDGFELCGWKGLPFGLRYPNPHYTDFFDREDYRLVYRLSNGMEKKTNGIISIAGPIVNIILGLIFFLILVSLGDFAYTETGYLVALTCVLGTRINFFLAAFNLLPIPPLDGSKVMAWSVPVWLITFAIAALLVLIFGGFL